MALEAAAAAALAGRAVVVTGATRGIGASVARALAAAGARPLLVARSAAALEALGRELDAPFLAADVSDEAAVSRLPDLAAARLGEVDAVVHAAGAFALAPVTSTPVEVFDRLLAVNLRAAFLLMRTFVPGMVIRGQGDFVSVGSIAGRRVFPENGAYSASKFGLRGLHAVLEAELRGTGVRAALVEAAATDTSLWDDVELAGRPGMPPRAAMLRPETVADAVLYALSRPPGAAVHNIILDRN